MFYIQILFFWTMVKKIISFYNSYLVFTLFFYLLFILNKILFVFYFIRNVFLFHYVCRGTKAWVNSMLQLRCFVVLKSQSLKYVLLLIIFHVRKKWTQLFTRIFLKLIIRLSLHLVLKSLHSHAHIHQSFMCTTLTF